MLQKCTGCDAVIACRRFGVYMECRSVSCHIFSLLTFFSDKPCGSTGKNVKLSKCPACIKKEESEGLVNSSI